MDFDESRLSLRLPPLIATRNGHAKHGGVSVTLQAEDVAAVPAALRDELARWIESGDELVIDAPSPDMATITRALERAVEDRKRADIDQLLALNDLEFEFDVTPDDYRDPRVNERMVRVKKRLAVEGEVQSALRSYAATIPYLKRAASEDAYPIAGPALDHLTTSVAAFDRDAMVLSAASAEFLNARVDVRKGATPYAFGVRDRILDHIEKLPRPDRVDIVVDAISRYRRAVYKAHRGTMKWTLDQPVTVVPVRVSSVLKDDRCIFFFADEDDRQRALKGDEDDTPF